MDKAQKTDNEAGNMTASRGEEIEGAAHMGVLLAKYRTELYAYLYSAVLNHHDAEDLVQDVSGVAVRCWRQYEPGTNCAAWLREIARRRVLEYARKRDKRGMVLAEPEILESLATSMQQLEERDPIDPIRTAFRECLQQLEGTARRVLDYRYAERLNVDTIATRISKSIQATYSLLKRAKAVLRECAGKRLAHPERMEEAT